jgi:hypothetical protein
MLGFLSAMRIEPEAIRMFGGDPNQLDYGCSLLILFHLLHLVVEGETPASGSCC